MFTYYIFYIYENQVEKKPADAELFPFLIINVLTIYPTYIS